MFSTQDSRAHSQIKLKTMQFLNVNNYAEEEEEITVNGLLLNNLETYLTSFYIKYIDIEMYQILNTVDRVLLGSAKILHSINTIIKKHLIESARFIAGLNYNQPILNIYGHTSWNVKYLKIYPMYLISLIEDEADCCFNNINSKILPTATAILSDVQTNFEVETRSTSISYNTEDCYSRINIVDFLILGLSTVILYCNTVRRKMDAILHDNITQFTSRNCPIGILKFLSI